MALITTPCTRTDLSASYGDGERYLPVVGFDDKGKAIVVRPDGSTALASASYRGWTFDRISLKS